MNNEIPDGSIVITPKEFYDGVKADIGDIKKALEPLSGMVEDVADLKTRVSALEARVWTASGGAAVLGIASGIVVALLQK